MLNIENEFGIEIGDKIFFEDFSKNLICKGVVVSMDREHDNRVLTANTTHLVKLRNDKIIFKKIPVMEQYNQMVLLGVSYIGKTNNELLKHYKKLVEQDIEDTNEEIKKVKLKKDFFDKKLYIIKQNNITFVDDEEIDRYDRLAMYYDTEYGYLTIYELEKYIKKGCEC